MSRITASFKALRALKHSSKINITYNFGFLKFEINNNQQRLIFESLLISVAVHLHLNMQAYI
jgi:hypothetical protein